jgi:hypothetical protein
VTALLEMAVWSPADDEADTLGESASPRPGWTKRCSCSCSFDDDTFRLLPYVGIMPDGKGGSMILRNCICGSTISKGSDEEVSP